MAVSCNFPQARGNMQSTLTILRPGKDWHMVAHLKLVLLRGIITTTRADIVLWFAVEGSVLLIKLPIPWEENMRENTSSMPSLHQSGWKSRVYPVEIRSRGFVGKVLDQLLRSAGMMGTSLQREGWERRLRIRTTGYGYRRKNQ